MKILINTCYGGFSFSERFCEEYEKRTGSKLDKYSKDRTSNDIIELFEELGSETSSGKYAELRIIEIPDDVEYYVYEYDGIESIHEKHRVWGGED